MMSDNKTNDFETQLMLLRAMTDQTGAIHEGQRVQLKFWGLLAFPHVDKKDLSAFPDVEKKTVTYQIHTKKKPPKNWPHLIASLDESIHWLFGPSWNLLIEQDDTVIYKGERKSLKKQRDNGKRDKRRARSKNFTTAKRPR
jgi:hypothetical protein